MVLWGGNLCPLLVLSEQIVDAVAEVVSIYLYTLPRHVLQALHIDAAHLHI